MARYSLQEYIKTIESGPLTKLEKQAVIGILNSNIQSAELLKERLAQLERSFPNRYPELLNYLSMTNALMNKVN
jgi:hypothetical protein